MVKLKPKVDDLEPELNISRQEILNTIDKWVSEGSEWVIDRIDSHYLNVTLYKPLNGSSYIQLPTDLRNTKKGLINIKNEDNECFRWCHIRHLHPQEKNPQRIKKEDKKMINEVNYDGINFPLSQKHYNKVEKQNSIRINVFGYENGQPFPIHISKETFEDQMNLLLITKDEKKHYVLIKDFNAFMYNQSKHKKKRHFCMYCLQCFSSHLLLTDVFENFRKTYMQYYKLDPCHYFTSPDLSWDAMLKMTNIKLELMTDLDMFHFIEKGMRGGVSYIANRYGNANNKYMKEYNEKAPSKYIMYLDANNLYGWAMSQHLPTGKFKWMTDKEISKIDLGKYKADGKKGLILEVDLEYPQELHDIHNDYPVTHEKVKVSNNMLSAYYKMIAEKYNISIGLVSKLIPTLRDKKEYVLHYRNLQLYLDLSLKIKKVHRVLKFDQSPWLKQYIDFNTEK